MAQFPAPYCGPITFSANVEPITLVNFAGINNPSPANLGVGPHQNFTAITGNVTAGQTYPITIKGNTDGLFTNAISVFIDWNKNNVFTDQGETFHLGTIFNSTGTDTVALTSNIVIPPYVTSGTTRMRVMKIYNNENLKFLPNPCNSNLAEFGQVEDYSLVVTSIPQCLTGNNFPLSVISTSFCDGGMNLISTQSQTGQYANIIVDAGKEYVFQSTIHNDIFTISNDGGLSSVYAGASPLIWKSNVSDTIRLYLYNSVSCGTDSFKRSTSVSCGTICLNGNLFPSLTFTPNVCDSVTENVISTQAHTGEYTNVQIQKGGFYTFGSSVSTDYITLSLDGNTAIEKGHSPLLFHSDTTAIIRFYVNSNQYCAVDTMQRTKYVKCSLLEVPGCVSNFSPASGDTLYVSVGSYLFSYDMPSTGGFPDFNTVYIGLDSINPILTIPVPIIEILNVTLEASDVGQTYYWWVVPENAAGISTCIPVKNYFKVLASPSVGIEQIKESEFRIYPNPANNILYVLNLKESIEYNILNTFGQLITTNKITKLESRIDISALSSGVYQLHLINKNGKSQYLKFIKQ